jgi:uncharacterized protein (UPF0332 family)
MKPPNWKTWIEDRSLCKDWFIYYIKKGMLRKKSLNKELHLRKARHNLDFGNWVKEKHKSELPRVFGKERFYDWVINAYYYAVYHGALALISAKGLSSKSHNATLNAVIWFYYHSKRELKEEDLELISVSISKEDLEIINKTKDMRERASYGVSYRFELNLVERVKRDSISFINKIKRILKE